MAKRFYISCFAYILLLHPFSALLGHDHQSLVAGEVALVEHHQAVRDRTETTFPRAVFISPDNNPAVGDRVWMAPLVVQEYSPQTVGGAPFERWGALTVGSRGVSIDTRRPTVYTTSSDVRIGEQRFVQQTFVWFYPPPSRGGPPQKRGFRQTLNRRGFAFVWELISDDPSPRVLYVSKPFERAAARQFGDPLPGRRFAAEAELQRCPDTVVARVVPPGPQRMGPFIYLDRPALRITTVRCRCEPSLVRHYSESFRYDLVPLKHLADLFAEANSPPDMSLPADSAELDGALRFPANL